MVDRCGQDKGTICSHSMGCVGNLKQTEASFFLYIFDMPRPQDLVIFMPMTDGQTDFINTGNPIT